MTQYISGLYVMEEVLGRLQTTLKPQPYNCDVKILEANWEPSGTPRTRNLIQIAYQGKVLSPPNASRSLATQSVNQNVTLSFELLIQGVRILSDQSVLLLAEKAEEILNGLRLAETVGPIYVTALTFVSVENKVWTYSLQFSLDLVQSSEIFQENRSLSGTLFP